MPATDPARATGPALEGMQRFMLWLIPAVEGFPRSQKFLLGDHIQSTALNCLECLIEATYTKKRDVLLGQANLCIEKIRILMRLAHDLKHIDARRYEFAVRSLNDVGRRVGGWRKADHAAQG